LFHRGWDQHAKLPEQIRLQCQATDQPAAALVQDLKDRGLLDETLVVWGGEFGRTVYCQGRLTNADYGRDHHPRCFSIWMAGGGIKPGVTYGATDDFSYNITEKPVHVHDLHATILHCLGIDHTRLTYKYQGRHFRLTDVHGNVVRDILSPAGAKGERASEARNARDPQSLTGGVRTSKSALAARGKSPLPDGRGPY
jgi:arylsulfatase A-like enzyme